MRAAHHFVLVCYSFIRLTRALLQKRPTFLGSLLAVVSFAEYSLLYRALLLLIHTHAAAHTYVWVTYVICVCDSLQGLKGPCASGSHTISSSCETE